MQIEISLRNISELERAEYSRSLISERSEPLLERQNTHNDRLTLLSQRTLPSQAGDQNEQELSIAKASCTSIILYSGLTQSSSRLKLIRGNLKLKATSQRSKVLHEKKIEEVNKHFYDLEEKEMDSRLSYDLNVHLKEMKLIEEKQDDKRRMTYAQKQKLNLRNIINHKDCLQRVESKTQGVRPSWELTTLQIEKSQLQFKKPLFKKLQEIKQNVLKKRQGCELARLEQGMQIPKEWKPKGPYQEMQQQRSYKAKKRRESSLDMPKQEQSGSKWDLKIGKEEHIRSLIEHHLISRSLIDFEGQESYEKTETPKFGE